MRCVLIQCTNSKRSEPAMATNLYDESAYYRKMRAYAKATGNKWYILSAKHGLLQPAEWVEPYDEFGLTGSQAHTIASELKLKGIDEVEIIAGTKYTDPLIPELEAKGIDVIELCAGMAIGERMAELDRLKEQAENHSLC